MKLKKNSTKSLIKLLIAIISIWLILYYVFFHLIIINPKEKDCKKYEGTLIKSHYNEQTNDIQLKLSNFNQKIFYINNIDTSVIKFSSIDSLIGKDIKIYAVKRWSIIDPKSKYNHIARLCYGDKILYTEYE